MTNEDYQLEELENAAVNKSSNAKRIAAAAGLLATGGAAGYAATNISVGSEDESMDTLTEEDLEEVADTGANQVSEPEVKSQPQPAPAPEPTPEPEPTPDEVDVSFDKTTHYYDEDNNLVATSEEGTVNGNKFTLLDVDGDRKADIFAYDENGNGIYDNHEVMELEGGNQIVMGHEATQHEDVFLASYTPEPEPEPLIEPYDINEEKDFADNNIHNDFEDEKTGENYSHDYAENNEDYNNGGVRHYSADDSNYAYVEEAKEESDYEYNDLAENDTADDSNYAYVEDAKEESDYEYNDLAENDTAEDSFDDLGSDSFDIV